MRIMLLGAAVIFAAGMGLTEVEGEPIEVEGIVIADAVARSAGPAAQSAAGYFTITNTTEQADRLLAVESDAAQRVEIHAHEVTDGIARMVEVEDGVEVPPGETVVFEQGGLHVMFMGLTEQWGADGGVVVTLVFEQAGQVPVTLDPGRVGHTHDPHAHDDEHGEGHDAAPAGHGHGHGGQGH